MQRGKTRLPTARKTHLKIKFPSVMPPAPAPPPPSYTRMASSVSQFCYFASI